MNLMGLRIGGGLGPFRASVGTSGFGVGVGPLSAYSRRRRGNSGGNVGCGLFILAILVLTGLYYMAVYWWITLPVAILLTIALVVLVRRYRRNAAARAALEARRAEEDRRAAIAELKRTIDDVKHALGPDFNDFARAAHSVLSTRRADREALRQQLGISASRAAQLQLMLEDHGVITPARGNRRNILLDADYAQYFQPTV